MKKKALNRILLFLAMLLLAGQFAFQLYLAKTDAQTTDEAVHLTAGYTYLTEHDFRFNPEHPILAKLLAATPLKFMHVNMPSNYAALWDQSSNFFFDSWRQNRILGEEVLYQSGNNPEQILFWGRFPIVVLTLLLGLSIWLIARKYFGDSGGLIALALYVFNPIVTAHGHLITTDIAVSLGYLLTTFTLLSFFKQRSWKNLLYLTLALAFAELVKFTAVIAYPAMIILFAYSCSSGIIKAGDRLKTFLKSFIVLAGVWLLIFACYGFKTTQIPEADSISQSMITANSTSDTTGTTKAQQSKFDQVMSTVSPVLVPRDYFKGLFMLLTHVENGHDSFLLGQFSNKGWWYYFPVVFVAKNPIPTLIILAFGLYFALAGKQKRENGFYLLSAFCFLVFAMTSKANLGVRHILPIFPILFIVCGSLSRVKSIVVKLIVIVCIAWLVFESIVTFPYYLSYFNQMFGGRDNGYKVAGDSNLDWGRDLRNIADYTKTHNLNPLYVEYGWDGPSSLDYYGINRLEITSLNRDSVGYLIIGASGVQSMPYQWLDKLPIYDRITPSVLVYKLNGTNE